jgi:hypothetical protein
MRHTQSTVLSIDTSQRAGEIYRQRLQQMTCSERIRLGAAIWEAGDSVQRAAALRKNPSADESEITFRLAVTRFGSEIARQVYQKSECP